MGFDSRDVTVLPCGLFLVEETEDRHTCVTVQSVQDDETPFGDHTRMVESHDGKMPVLGASFKGGGWLDLWHASAEEVAAFGGFDAMLSPVKGHWAAD